MDEQEKNKLERELAELSQKIANDQGNAELYFHRGNLYRELGRNDKAIRDYDKAIELKPNYAEAYNNRGVAQSNQKKYPDAINDYNQAIKLDPENAEAYNNRGNAQLGLKNYTDAINDYNQAIKIDPTLAMTYYNRGVAKEAMGLAGEAKEDFKKANELDPRLFYRESSKNIKEEVRGEIRESDEKSTKVQNFQDILDSLRKTYGIHLFIWTVISVLVIFFTVRVLFGLPLFPEFFPNSLHLPPAPTISSDLVSAISIKVFFLGLVSFCLAMYRASSKLYLEAKNRLAMAKLLENIRGNEHLESEIKNLAYPQLFSAIIYKLYPDKSKGEKDKNVTDSLPLDALISTLKK